MDAITLLKEQIEFARGTVQGTVGDLTPEMCQTPPGGKAHPIGATYGHMTVSEDFIVNMIVRGQTPLLMGEWADKSGLSEPPPRPGGDVFDWAKRVQVDPAKTREYAQAVYKNTDDFVDSLKPEDLDRQVEVPGFGNFNVGRWLALAAVIHPSNHIGEISALKGVQGVKGYPF